MIPVNAIHRQVEALISRICKTNLKHESCVSCYHMDDKATPTDIFYP